MSVFEFKQFDVINERSPMKVNTDGVLLGAAVTLRAEDRTLLDAGTGTGVIALMLSQRLGGEGERRILGIDSDAAAAEEAAENFRRSPWSGQLEAACRSLSEQEGIFDVIVSNPPYFDLSLLNPDPRRRIARHGRELSFRTLVTFSAEHLAPHGRLSLILPADQEAALLRHARGYGLYPFRLLRIRTTDRKPPRRLVAELSRYRGECKEEALTIQDGSAFTAEYRSLTGPFYKF